jgi:cytochrome c oxidase assembly factor CtaG
MFAVAFFLLITTLAPEQASAHWSPGMLIDGPVWEYDPWLFGPLYAGGVAFYLGSRNLWRSAGFGRGVRLAQATAFWVGWTSLALTVVSPLHWLGEHLFTAHMVEHGVVILVAAPLLAYSRPGAAFLWSAPIVWRKGAGALLNSRLVRIPWTSLRHPILATTLQVLALWAWHTPPLYVWALKDPTAHRLEHLSLFLTALLFWWTLFHCRSGSRSKGSNPLVAIGCLFLTMMQSGALGALLTFSPGLWYPDQEKVAADFGLTPLQDQQMAGLIMWAPMGLVYTAAALYFAQVLLPRSMRPVEIAPLRSRRTQGAGESY